MIKYILIIFIFLFTLTVNAQEKSFIRHHGDMEIIAGPTWDIQPAENGFCFFANGDNLLVLSNGILKSHPFETELRSTYISKDKIYAGGINEIGYFETSDNGNLVYTSLASKLDSITKNTLGNIWNIFEYDNTVYFVADALVLKYVSGEFTILNPDAKINCAALKSGVLYISGGDGIKYLMGSDFKEPSGNEILKDKIIKGFVNYQNGLLAITEKDGIFYYNGRTITPIKTSADDYLKKSVAFCTAENQENFAIGTVKGGIVEIDKKNFSTQIINENSGLKDNTIISLAYSDNGTLWAGLNNGIDEILLGLPLKELWTEDVVGQGFNIENIDSIFYIATNRGVFTIDKNKDNYTNFNAINGLEGAAWNLYKAFNKIYCLHDRGLFQLDGKNTKSLGGIKGFWGMVQTGDSVGLAATYSDLYGLKLKSNSMFDFYKIEIHGSFNNMVFDGENVWLHSKGVTQCLKAKYIASEKTLNIIQEFDTADGLPEDKNYTLQIIDKKICAVSTKGVAIFNNSENRFVSTDNISGLDCKNGLLRITQNGNSMAGISKNCLKIKSENENIDYHFCTDFLKIHPNSAAIRFVNDSILMIASQNGIQTVNIKKIKQQTDTSKILASVYVSDSLVWQNNHLNKTTFLKIPFKQANLKFCFYPIDNFEQYSYRLNSDLNWSIANKNTVKEFTSLREGKYNFEIIKTNLEGEIIGRGNFLFMVTPPWYRTIPAYVFYFLMTISVAILVIKTVRKHYHKKQQEIVERNKEDMQRLEIQHEMESAADKQRISELEKQKLKDDLDHKTTELADMALSLAGKNEILNTLKNDISDIYKTETINASLKTKLSSLTTKIDSQLQNDNFINRFEEQFDLLHNNFMRKIKDLYPTLSRNDYMLCAYIRMELSTKEIAQMLNMSVRGVESQKYRLKKKISLETDLNDYLKSIESQN